MLNYCFLNIDLWYFKRSLLGSVSSLLRSEELCFYARLILPKWIISNFIQFSLHKVVFKLIKFFAYISISINY